MNEENNKPSSENESENPSDINEMTEEDLEQVAGGLTSIPTNSAQYMKHKAELSPLKLNNFSINDLSKDVGKV